MMSIPEENDDDVTLREGEVGNGDLNMEDWVAAEAEAPGGIPAPILATRAVMIAGGVDPEGVDRFLGIKMD